MISLSNGSQERSIFRSRYRLAASMRNTAVLKHQTMFFIAALMLLSMSSAWSQESTSDAAGDVEPAETRTGAEQENTGGFVPVPIFITEPAIGEGLGLGIVYFHEQSTPERNRLNTGRSVMSTGRESKAPPTATGIFGFRTNDGSEGYGVGHARTFQEDTYRLVGAAAEADIEATYYLGDVPFKFSVDGQVIFSRLLRRIGDSNFFGGGAVSATDANADFRSGLVDFSFTDIGIAAIAIYDARDDTMLPSDGLLGEFSVWHYDEALGGDFDYQKIGLKLNSFHKLGERFVLGMRLQADSADGDVPFYAEPYVSLRGIPALRYLGDTATVVEVEGRFRVADRWIVLSFAGKGFVDSRSGVEKSEDDIDSIGAGFRYLMLPKQNVWLGVDVARGPEEDFGYIQIGSPW